MIIEYKVREYRKSDESQVLELLELVFNRNITSDYWNWKYFDNPLKKQVIAVTEYESQIIGNSSGFLCEVKVGDKMYLTHYGGDLAVHPKYRRMGIANKMRELKEEMRRREGVELSSAVTVNPIIINNRNKRGNPPFPKKLLEMIYLEDVKKEDFGYFKKLGYQAYKSGRKLLNSKNWDKSICNIVEISSFGYEADVFWENIKDNYSLLFKRDSACLNWRYCDPRAGPFKVFAAMNNNEMYGYCAVLVTESNCGPRGYIADLCVLPGMNNVVGKLLEKAVDVLKREVNMIKYLVVEGHPNAQVFSWYGFLPVSSALDVRYNEKHQNVRTDLAKYQCASSEKLFVQYGDTDLF